MYIVFPIIFIIIFSVTNLSFILVNSSFVDNMSQSKLVLSYYINIRLKWKLLQSFHFSNPRLQYSFLCFLLSSFFTLIMIYVLTSGEDAKIVQDVLLQLSCSEINTLVIQFQKLRAKILKTDDQSSLMFLEFQFLSLFIILVR